MGRRAACYTSHPLCRNRCGSSGWHEQRTTRSHCSVAPRGSRTARQCSPRARRSGESHPRGCEQEPPTTRRAHRAYQSAHHRRLVLQLPPWWVAGVDARGAQRLCVEPFDPAACGRAVAARQTTQAAPVYLPTDSDDGASEAGAARRAEQVERAPITRAGRGFEASSTQRHPRTPQLPAGTRWRRVDGRRHARPRSHRSGRQSP